MARRRHSTAFDALGEADLAEYRRLCLPRDLGGAGKQLEAIVAWLAERSVGSTVSSVHRDAQHFRAVEETKQRLRLSSDAAREIVAAATAAGGVAATQAAATELYTQQVLDLLIRERQISVDDLPRYAQLGRTLGGLTHSQIALYRAEVERRAQQAAAKAAELADGAAPDVKARLDDLAREILGVSA